MRPLPSFSEVRSSSSNISDERGGETSVGSPRNAVASPVIPNDDGGGADERAARSIRSGATDVKQATLRRLHP